MGLGITLGVLSETPPSTQGLSGTPPLRPLLGGEVYLRLKFRVKGGSAHNFVDGTVLDVPWGVDSGGRYWSVHGPRNGGTLCDWTLVYLL